MRSLFQPKTFLPPRPWAGSSAAAVQSRMSTRRLLAPLADAVPHPDVCFAVSELGDFRSGGRRHALPRVSLRGPPGGGDTLRLGFFGAIHGDEPEGAEALLAFALGLLAEPETLRGYALEIYPVCNPTGWEDGTRHSRAGRDLNREFWRGSREPEIYLLERELGVRQFHGIVALHSDDNVSGCYAYARGAVLTEALVEPALAAAAAFLPRASEAVIDGFPAERGVIRHHCFEGVLANPRELHPAPFEVIWETPQRASREPQVAATLAALRSILANYRSLTAIGGEL